MENFSRRRDRKYEKSISKATVTCCYSLFYYLWVVMTEFEKPILSIEKPWFTLILAKRLKLQDRVRKVTDYYIKELVDRKILTPLEKTVSESNDTIVSEINSTELIYDSDDYSCYEEYEAYEKNSKSKHFRGSSVLFKYEEDSRVNTAVTSYTIENEVDANLHRCCLFGGVRMFIKILANIFFYTDDAHLDDSSFKLPSKIFKAGTSTEEIKFLMDEIGLSEAEGRYLLLKKRIKNYPELSTFLSNSKFVESDWPRYFIDCSEADFNKILSSNGKLYSFGFIEEGGVLSQGILECMEGKNLDCYFADLLKEEDCNTAFDLNSFNVPEIKTEIFLNFLKSEKNASILLYGKPGAGKTEYAKALAKMTGLKTMIFKNESEANGTKKSVLGKLNCLLSLNRPDSILIVDEAESVLQTQEYSFFGLRSSGGKGVVNKMLENNQNKVIWIVNSKNQMDISTLRRFNLSHEFPEMPVEQMRQIAKSKIASLELEGQVQETILDMFEKYHVTGASVENVAKVIRSMKQENPERLSEKVEVVLKENSKLIYGQAKLREKVNPAYDISVLNTTIQAEEIAEMLENAKEFAKRNKCVENGIRILFWGISGTGKTEFARYLGSRLNKKILIKRVSDIFSKYVGETEKNIASAFSEAESTDSILLFDEADSFFTDRNRANNSWERTQVNEFLTQLEEFSGIVICTTNLKDIMDEAMARRFQIKVEFKGLEFEGIKKLLEKYFSSITFSECDLNRLKGIESVTPGDFGALSGKIRFMRQSEINASFIVNELLEMQTYKNCNGTNSKVIGFAS